MANAFRDLLSKVGYSTNRADNPQVVREREDNPPGIGAGSISVSGVIGPSTLFQDDRGPLVQRLIPSSHKDSIATPGVIETTKYKR